MVAVKRYYPVLPAVPKNSSERSKTVFRAAQWLRRQIIQRVEHRRRHIKYCDALLPFCLGYNNNNRFLSQQLTFSSPSQHFLGIPSFLLPLARKLPFIRRPNYCCLATADLLVGLVSQPLAATYWMSLVHEHWSLCRYARDGVQISSYALCGVSLLTLTAISVDRLLAALLVGTRYRQIITLKRTYIITTSFWILSVAAGSFSILHTRISIWFGIILIPSYSVICTEHGKIQEGTLGAVSISCLLCTKIYNVDCDH